MPQYNICANNHQKSQFSGLERRVNDSSTLGAAFSELVDKDPDLTGNLRALSRRVATRWNTDRVAVDSHIHFKGPVQWLTGNSKYNLKHYALDDEQWSLATELSSVLEVGINSLSHSDYCINPTYFRYFKSQQTDSHKPRFH